MIFKELKFFIQKHIILSTLIYIQITLFFLLLGTFLIFLAELKYESQDLQQMYEGKAIYQILDGYYDDKDYSNFISKDGYLNILKNYYNELNNSQDFAYLAMFDHYLMLNDENIPLEFGEGYENGAKKHTEQIGDKTYTSVKSFQLNESAVHFFNLSVSKGRLWSKEDFNSSNEVLPVIVGADLAKVYNLNDERTINFYGKQIKIKIIGFLLPNTKIYYMNNPEFYLDKYILLPYINYLQHPQSEIEESFQRISYFAMINGFLVTENTDTAIQKMFQRVESISQKVSFEHYSFIGLNPHFQKYRGLITVLNEDRILVQSIFISIAILNIIFVSLLFSILQRKRTSFFITHYLNGASKKKLMAIQWCEIGCFFILSYLTSYIILDQVLKIGEINTQFILFLIGVILTLFISFLSSMHILTNRFIKNINEE